MFESEYYFYGSHKEKLFYLAKDKGVEREDSINIFQRVVDVLIMAPLVGLIYNRKSKPEPSSTNKSTVFPSTIKNERSKLIFVYRIVMLLDSRNELSKQERLDRAFRYDNDPKKTEENMKLFNEYVLGGIDYLYDHFKDDYGNREKILEDIASLLELERLYDENIDDKY